MSERREGKKLKVVSGSNHGDVSFVARASSRVTRTAGIRVAIVAKKATDLAILRERDSIRIRSVVCTCF